MRLHTVNTRICFSAHEIYTLMRALRESQIPHLLKNQQRGGWWGSRRGWKEIAADYEGTIPDRELKQFFDDEPEGGFMTCIVRECDLTKFMLYAA